MSHSPYSILLVDDDESIHRVVGKALRERGYVVADAADGEIGYQMFSTQSFDAVITDGTMPRMTGEELARKIKAASPKTPVLHITASLLNKKRGDLFDEVLRKPFAKDAFLDALERVLGVTGLTSDSRYGQAGDWSGARSPVAAVA
jgi:CheY-like chemotaxis protein